MSEEHELKLTPASEWRKAFDEGELVELPSGRVARLRKAELQRLLRLGYVPDKLTPIVGEMLGLDSGEDDERTPQDYATAMLEMVDGFCLACFIYPKVIESGTPGEGEILLDHIPESDKIFVQHWAQEQQTAGLDKFPDETAQGMESMDVGP